jgi:hypothetical protein
MGTREIKGNEAVNRILHKVEDYTALTAIPSVRIAPGAVIAVKDVHAAAVYDEASTTAAASGRVYVPDDVAATAAYISDPATAPGRWHVIASDAILTTTDAAVGAVKRTVTVGHADLTDAVNGEAQAINIGATLPANARIIGVDLHDYTPFTGGSASAVALDIGTSGDVDAIIDGADVFAAAVDGGPATIPAGIRPNKTFVSAGAQLLATFTPDGGHTLLALTAGSIIIDVWYLVLP